MTGIHQPVDEAALIERYLEIKERMHDAARKVGRNTESVQLIVVTKTFDQAHLRPLLRYGHKSYGENRVQEAMAKWPALREEFPDIELHLIGPLQSNKTKEAVALFDVIHTLDRPKLAAVLALEMEKQRKHPKLLMQVNTGLETQKAGVAPNDAEVLFHEFSIQFNLKPEGLMCIPPAQDNPLHHFEMLKNLAQHLAVKELSMGMSSDFETAIAQGATMIRVGSAIFGAR